MRKVAATGAAVVMSLGVLSACGGDSDSSGGDVAGEGDKLTKDNFVATVTDALVEGGSSKVVTKSEGGAGLNGKGVQFIGESSKDSATQMSFETAGQTMEMRVVDEMAYLNFGQMSQNKFVEIDLNDSEDPTAQQMAGLAENVDLRSQIELMDGAIISVTQKGESEEIDGVDAQPYVVKVDGAKMAKAQGGSTQGVPKSATFTFYVGDDQIVRRLVSESSAGSMTSDYTAWGDEVDVKKPAAGDITDKTLQELAGAAQQ